MDPAANFAKSAVSQGYSSTATSIVLESEDLNLDQWPDPATYGAYNAVWWDATNYADPAEDENREIVRVTGKSSNTLTITRAQEGTSATAKNTTGSTYKIAIVPTAKFRDDLVSAMVDAGSVYGWITDDPYDAAGDGVTDDHAAFEDAVAALTHIVVPSGTYLFSDDVTIPSTVTLQLFQGAVFSVASTKTLTINGNLIVGNWAWQAGSGTITISGGRTYSSAVPSSGTWQTGDTVWNSAPSAPSWAGWRCTSGGTPGTWVGFGAITKSVESSSLDVSSIGTKTCQIAHGLSYTPDAQDIMITVYRDSGSNDCGTRGFWIQAIDGTNIDVYVYVSVAAASTTVKAALKIFPPEV